MLEDRINLAVGVTLGLWFLHSQEPNILHMDLMSVNIVVLNNLEVKLKGFGFKHNRNLVEGDNKNCTALNWFPPEYIEDQNNYTEESDIYSLGVVLWEIFTSNVPYEGKSPLQILRMISLGELLKIPKSLPILLQQLLEMCWDSIPSRRPKIEFIHKHLTQVAEEKKITIFY